MVSRSGVLRGLAVAGSFAVSIFLAGCAGAGSPAGLTAGPTSVSTIAPITSVSATQAPVSSPPPGSGAGGNLGVYETEAGSTVELLADGTCTFHTTKPGLAGCTYEIHGSNIQFKADDGSQFGYIFSNGCIYAGKIGSEPHATFCKK
jgi:hypothetical protein